MQQVTIQCTGNNAISPAHVFNGCYDDTAFPCPVIPDIVNASPLLVEAKHIVYTCDAGHEVVAAGGVRITEFNCLHGEWTPDPSGFSCSSK